MLLTALEPVSSLARSHARGNAITRALNTNGWVMLTVSDNGKILVTFDFVQWILNEIEDPAFKRQQVADTYAILISKGQKEFKEINAAIVRRWSLSALMWIKREAWKQLKKF